MSNKGSLKDVVTELNGTIEQTFHYERSHYELQKKIEANKKIISKGLGSKSSLIVDVDGASFRVNKDIKMDIEFYREELAQALGKDVFKSVIDKEVTITDLEGLIEMLKEYGVSPKKFKKFIEVEESISHEKVDKLLEDKTIKVEDLFGTYKVDYHEEIKIRKIK